MRLIRAALILLGLIPIGIGAYGLWNYYPPEMLLQIGKWLLIGVVLHDGVLVPLTLLLAGVIWWASRRLPAATGRIVIGGLMVAGVVSLVAAPVIWRKGASTVNPTLLTQDYSRNLVWVLIVIGVGTVVLAIGAWLLGRGNTPRHGSANTPVDELDKNANSAP